MKCWLNYTYIMKSFKVRHITNIKQKYFFELQKICFDKKKIRYMRGRSLELLVRTTFQSLNVHAIKQSDLKRKFAQHFEVHRQKVTQRFLKEWSALYQYYSKFTRSQYGYTQVKASQIQFKKRYFQCLKNYLMVRRVHKANIIKADNKFFHRYVKICFRNWAWYHLHFTKHQKFAYIDVNRRFKK